MQFFATNEGARVFEKVEEVWDQFIFHDCSPLDWLHLLLDLR
jgi:hypothetical protein